MDEITSILRHVAAGDRKQLDLIYPQLYEQLHKLATQYLKRERPGHTLQPTALIHEAYARLMEQRKLDFKNREHFLAINAVLMRRILIEYARTKLAQKRGGGIGSKWDWHDEDVQGPSIDLEQLIDLDAALLELEGLDERQVRIIEMRLFGGMRTKDVAKTLNISTRTVEVDWQMARAWLQRRLGNEGLWD